MRVLPPQRSWRSLNGLLTTLGACCLLLGITTATAHTPEDVRPDTLRYSEVLRPDTLPLEFFLWENDPRYLTPRESMLHEAEGWMIHQQEVQSRRVMALSRGLDRALSGETYIDRDNDSYVRLGAATRFQEDGRLGVEPEARFRLDLPTVEEKLRLVIESDAQDLSSLREQQQRGTLREEETEDGFTAGALRVLIPLTERWETSADLGARLRFPPQAFARARAASDWELDENWDLRVDQRFFWFTRDGIIIRNWLGFSRPLGPNWNFQASTETRWLHADRYFETAQVFRTQRRFRNRHFLRYRAGVLGDSDRHWRTTEYFVDTLYRNRLYDNWLFGEIIPAVRFERDNNFRSNASITLRIEVFFSARGSLR